jgi:hypothetical protein
VTSDELIVPLRRSTMIAVAGVAMILVVIGAEMIARTPGKGPMAAVVGSFFLVFFGSCAAYTIHRLVSSTPALVINHDGIVDTASLISVGPIRWSEIAELGEYRFGTKVFFSITLKDPNALFARQSSLKRAMLRANRWAGAGHVNIPQTILPMRVAVLIAQIEQRFGAESGRL